MIKLSSCPKRVTLTLSLAPPPSEEKELSVHCAIVGFVELVEGEIHSVCGDGLSVQRVGSHFIAGPGSLTLELCKLSPVMDGDEQLPDGQERYPNQEDTANHG